MGQNGAEQSYGDEDEYGGSILGECPFKAKSHVTIIDRGSKENGEKPKAVTLPHK